MSAVITTVDMHTGGSPMRIITSGLPEIKGDSYKEQYTYVSTKLDYIRKFLCHEPRGYRFMTSIMQLTPDKGADLAVVFLTATLYLPMCGEALTSFGRFALDNKLVERTEPETKIVVQVPCGMITCYVECTNGKAGRVRLKSVPSFMYSKDIKLTLEDGSAVRVDLPYSGCHYVMVSDRELGLDLSKKNFHQLGNRSYDITVKMAAYEKERNGDESPYVYGTVVYNHVTKSSEHFVNIGDMLINRGYCGSATIGHATLDYFKGSLKLGESRIYKSVVTGQGTTATVVRKVNHGNREAVIIQIHGMSHYTGKHEFYFEDSDSIKGGFLV